MQKAHQEEISAGEYGTVKSTTVSTLRELGLSSYGARAFLAILESQPVSATSICKNTQIPDSKVYYALKELEDKNLIMIQVGTPSTYRVSGTKRILAGLESGIESEYRKKIESARRLEKSLEPLIAKSSAHVPDVDLAYIIKGFKNIVEKMKEAAQLARKEIVFMASNENLVHSLEDTLAFARNQNGISLKVAMSEELSGKEAKNQIRSNRTLLCNCNILIADSEKLVSAELGDSAHQYAIVTQNESMIALMRKCYDSPNCCC